MAKAPAGQSLAWTANYPYSIGFIAAFKVEHGRIVRIDSTAGALPYRMPSHGPPISHDDLPLQY